jgi:hypothetical protein
MCLSRRHTDQAEHGECNADAEGRQQAVTRTDAEPIDPGVWNNVDHGRVDRVARDLSAKAAGEEGRQIWANPPST